MLLMPFKSAYCQKRALGGICGLPPSTLTTMRIIGPVFTLWWLGQTCFVFFLMDNSRISKGRYFIRYSYEVEMLILLTVTINRIGYNCLYFQLVELRILVNFVLFLLLLLEVKWGDGIVHPLTKKYFMVFCLTPCWFVISQAIKVLTFHVVSYAFLVALVSFSLFVPVFIFKIDEIDLTLVALERPDTIENPKRLVNKLDTLLVLLREEQLGDEKYSILLEGVIREFQEYSGGEEVELLNNFTRAEVLNRSTFFQKRHQAFLRLISLYFMKGISR